MKLEQAINHFSTVYVDGWDQTNQRWIPAVAKGSILTYDRFITERAFGQKKRIFQMSGSVGLPTAVSAIRDPYGNRYMVGYMNPDIAHNEQYNTVYLIQRADYDAEVIEYVTEVAASGAAVGKTATVVTTMPVDLDKISTSRSSEFDTVYYSGFVATAPLSVPITTDNELRINDIMYDIQEVYESVGLRGLKLNKRSNTQ